jgi:4-hydroxy-3-methylbut-2-enyl diphosphate reductase
MIVIGGFNSSNTHHLCEIAEQHCPTFHIEGPEGLMSPERILHKPSAKGRMPVEAGDWLPAGRPLTVGVTAGASTPNRAVGEVIEKLLEWSAPMSAGV